MIRTFPKCKRSNKSYMKKTTIIDIANKTGYSKSTVSRAMRGGANLRKTTMDKILKAAKSLNYYPNEMARSLVTSSKSNFIGIIVSDLKNESYVELIEAIQRSVKNTSYHITLCNTDYDIREEKRFMEFLIKNRAAGVVVAAPELNDRNIEILLKANMPFVVWGTEVDTTDVDIVSVDNYGGARMAMQYLIDNGHRDIVHFAGAENFGVTNARINAYKDVMSENGIKISSKNIIHTKNTIDSAYDMAKKLEGFNSMPTAIHAYCDYVALGVLKYFLEKGFKVPDDISIIGFDDIEMSGFRTIDLTTIRQPFSEIGEKILEIIIRKIKNPDFNVGKEKIYIKPTLIKRSTVKNIN